MAQEYRTTARRLANVRNLNKINILRRSLFRCHDGLMMMMMMVIHMLLYIHIYIYFFRSYISREWKKRRTSGDYSLLMDNETSYYSIKCDKWLKFRLKTRKDRNETSFFKAFVYFFFSSVFHRSITFMVRAVFTRKKERYLEIVQQRFSREKEKKWKFNVNTIANDRDNNIASSNLIDLARSCKLTSDKYYKSYFANK